jgi:futalosine hydrolase
MRILVVAATEAEVINLKSAGHDEASLLKDLDFELLITGVGMVATAFKLGQHLAVNQYDLVINLGIAGSFDREIALGEVLEISRDTLAELGAEDDARFLPIEELGFGEATFYPGTELANLYNLFNTFGFKKATAITVNSVHGNDSSIAAVAARLNPQIESMEGAAFFYACREMNVPCLQIRAVSNYVEKRNRANWNIGLAIKNLNTFAIEFLKLYA